MEVIVCGRVGMGSDWSLKISAREQVGGLSAPARFSYRFDIDVAHSLTSMSLSHISSALLSPIVLSTHPLRAQSFEVEFDTTSSLQVEPFDRPCQVWATVRNTGSQEELIMFDVDVVPQEGWMYETLMYLYLEPG